MTYLFQNATAFDPYTGQGVPNAVGQVFALADTAFATPLAVTLLSSGLQTTELVSDQYSQLPGFDAGDNAQVVFKSGEFTKILNTSTPIPGPVGDTGKSAFEVAVDGGYTGTEADYNLTLADAPNLVTRAETAEQAAIDAAGLVGAPAGDAVLAAISAGGAARDSLIATIAVRQVAVSGSEHGVTYDGVTDDTVAAQAAIDAGYTRKLPVYFGAGAMLLTDTLLVRSGQTVEGIKGATQFKQTTPGKACMASHNWVAGNPGPSGHMTLRNLWFIGEGTNAASHGLIARDYLSNFENLIFSSTGGNGFHLTYLNSSGAAYGGSSMVDNRYMDLDARDCKGWGLFLGELDNNKFTDAYIDRVYVSAGAGAPGAIYCGSTGGWQWGKVHTYGQATSVGMDIYNLNNTSFAQLYVEGGNDANLRLNRIQRNVTIGSMSARGPAVAGGKAVQLSKSSLVTEASVLIGSLNVMQDNDFAYTGVHLDTSAIKTQIGHIGTDGAFPARITKIGGTAASSVIMPGDISVTSPVRSSGETLTVKAIPLALSNRAVWSGAGVKTVVLPLPDLRGFSVIHGTISVVGVRNYNGSHNQKWRADLVVTSKATGDPWSVYKTDIIAPAGFITAPALTIDKAAKTLTVTFEATDIDAYGAVSYQLEWA